MRSLFLWIRNFFGISRIEANGFVILIPLIFVIISSPYAYKYWSFENGPVELYNIAKADSLLTQIERNIYIDSVTRAKFRPSPRFEFAENKSERSTYKPEVYKPLPVARPLTTFDINTADTASLKRLKGIGSVLSARIVKYRDLLGGFTDKSQYQEVYGLNASVIANLDSMTLIAEDYSPERINVNNVQEWELSRHPYISKRVAKAINSFRFQHGKIQGIEDLKNIHLMDSLTIDRISPYLSF